MKTIADLRAALFETLDGLRNKDNPIDIERAKAINDVAQTIINTAKVEVEHLKTTGKTHGSGFIPEALPAPAGDKPGQTVEQIPGGRKVTHRLVG